MEAVQIIASYAGYCITIITLFTLLVKPVRNAIIRSFTDKEHEKEQSSQLSQLLEKVDELQTMSANQTEILDNYAEALRSSIRSTITHMYYKYIQIGSIPSLEKENLAYLYDAYSNRLKGNSYVKRCYDELMALPICDSFVSSQKGV